MDVHILPALSDNYMYVVVDKNTNTAAVVDPVEADKVVEFVRSKGLTLTSVLTTHHHWDHAGGNKNMLKAMPQLRVYGGEERVEAVTDIVGHGHGLSIGTLEVECLCTPCHTRGHVCYKVSSGEDISLFTGDTLFVAGCGKFFEGTAEQMYKALVQTIGSLPGHTKIYCGHEYTLSNLKYAKHVEPDNVNIDRKMQWAEQCRARHQPTVPSTLAEERTYNPFVRVDQDTVHRHTQHTDHVENMHFLRTEKNNFRA